MRLRRASSASQPASNRLGRWWHWLRRYWVWCLLAVVLGVPLGIYTLVSLTTAAQVYYATDRVPNARAALLLGTARYTEGGGENLFFQHRIQAASALFKAGKVERIIVSGDNRHRSYNEPREMYRALLEAGVPDSVIVMDFAGFRTLDSVVRADRVFGQHSFIVISQRFHIERALFIANSKHIKAYGFVADDAGSLATMIKVQFREVLARGMTLLDCYVLGTQPRFLGEAEAV
jgi:SanA protein